MTDTAKDDLVEWLRKLVSRRISAFGPEGMIGCRYGEAADEIESLRSQLAKARDALEHRARRERGSL